VANPELCGKKKNNKKEGGSFSTSVIVRVHPSTDDNVQAMLSGSAV
jgi:hypothetical protein